MLVGVVGEDATAKELLRLLGLCGCISDVEATSDREWRGQLSFEGGLDALVHIRTGHPKGAQAVVYINGGADAECASILQVQQGPKQPPYAVVLTQAQPKGYENIEAGFNQSRFYLGTHPACSQEDLEGLWWSLYHAAEFPGHVLWDRPQSTFTAAGWRAVQRLFWWHDTDKDSTLNDKELAALLTATREDGTDVPADEVEATKRFIVEQQAELKISNFVSDNGNLTIYALIALCESWLSDSDSEHYWGRLRGLWGALLQSGVHHTGNPWSPQDLEAVSINPKTDLLQLSFTGVEFLEHVYTEKFASPDGLWKFTPGTQYSRAGEPPWADVSGLPGSREDPAPYTLEAFVSSWRFVTLRKHHHLVVFARCWGYEDDPSSLFVCRKRREFRKDETDLPNILQCLVLGSPRCGKTALRKRLTGQEEYTQPGDPYVPTKEHSITIVPQGHEGDGDQFDLVLHEIPDRDVATLLGDAGFMSLIDAVLMCYDGDDVYSFSYVAEKFPLITRLKKMPVLLVMTKTDLLGDDLRNLQDQEYTVQPNEFARSKRLFWPPAMVSCYPPPPSLKVINDIQDLPESINMLCRYPEDYTGRDSWSPGVKVGLCVLTTLTLSLGACFSVARFRRS